MRVCQIGLWRSVFRPCESPVALVSRCVALGRFPVLDLGALGLVRFGRAVTEGPLGGFLS